MILSRMDRWYEGPSLAEEEAAEPEEEIPPQPETLPSEPLEIDVDEQLESEAPGLADSAPLDTTAPAGEDRMPASEPLASPDSTPSQP